jgi:uncharacterized membrane protein
MGNSASNFFSGEQKSEVVKAIQAAEQNTSGEIRVHVENNCKGETLDRASFVFAKLNMHKTEQRNGVLIYLAIKDKKFAIIGDEGINKVVPENFWDNTKEVMKENFVKGNFCEGLCLGIKMAGEQLKQHFPYQSNDVNELSDEISFGK